MRWLIDSFVSFKTMLYLFYIIILFISQIIDFYPEMVGGNLKTFVIINRYNIVLLIAFDKLIGHFLRDRKRMAEISGKLDKHLSSYDGSSDSSCDHE
jgi:hypothetical protein